MIWLGLVLWHINHWRLFHAKSTIYIYIYIHTHIYIYTHTYTHTHIYIYVCVCVILFVLWHINHCRLFNVKPPFNIYFKYIGFGLVGYYGISTIVGYLMPNPLYTYETYRIWLAWVLWLINHCKLFNAKSSIHKY